MKNEIDIVVTWLDSKDKKWLAEKEKWQTKVAMGGQLGNERRRFDGDADLIKYWFRLVEKNAPFVRKIFFVTYGHLPEWLDTNNEKLVVVKHSDYIPRKYLPTFNSTVIETNLFRIKGLSEKFVYLNDDVYLSARVRAEDFFVGDKVKQNYSEMLLSFDESLGLEFRKLLFTVARTINNNFDKRKVMRRYPRVFFNLKNWSGTKNAIRWIGFNKYVGLIPAHLSMPFFKSTFEDVWQAEPEQMDEASRSRFRGWMTASPYLMEAWQLFSGRTVPFRKKGFGKLFEGDKVTTDMLNAIREEKYKVICLNGEYSEKDLGMIKRAFAEVVPKKSGFEK